MKNAATAMALACSMAALASAPVVKDGSVTMTQDPSTRLVTINYEIEGEPAIVTVDICTNGVSIGGENLRYFAGDVNRKVSVDSHTCTWRPDKAWPGHLITNGSVSAVVTAWATNAPPPYMVVSLTVKDDITFYADAGSLPGGVTNDVYKTECLVLRHIPAANVRWRMGSPEDERGRNAANEKSHYVTLANDFYLGVYEVTQRQYELMTGDRPSYFANDDYYATRPVEMVLPSDLRGSSADWPSTRHVVDGSSFFGKLRAQVSGVVAFDLPLEAQWEFACRAGTTSALYTGKELEEGYSTSSPNVQEIARFKQTQAETAYTAVMTSGTGDQDTTKGTAKVGSYRENGYGLYDMIGNVLEWCLDYWCQDVSEINPETGASEATNTSLKRVKRGGCYAHTPERLRSAYRIDGDYNKTRASDGFRVCAPVGIP